MKEKKDLTINQYATQLRSYMVGKTQVEIQNAIGLWRGSLSALKLFEESLSQADLENISWCTKTKKYIPSTAELQVHADKLNFGLWMWIKSVRAVDRRGWLYQLHGK